MVGRKRKEFCNQLRELWLFRAVLHDITPNWCICQVSGNCGSQIFNIGRLYKLMCEVKNWRWFPPASYSAWSNICSSGVEHSHFLCPVWLMIMIQAESRKELTRCETNDECRAGLIVTTCGPTPQWSKCDASANSLIRRGVIALTSDSTAFEVRWMLS